MAKKKLYSLNALALECGRNFRTLSKALSNVKPDGKDSSGKPRWYISTTVAALAEHERRTGRVPARAAPERFDPAVEAQIAAIEISGAEVDALLKRLRAEPSVERRRTMVENGAGRCVGAHERALAATIGSGTDAFLRQLFVDQQMQAVMGQVADLCEWRVEEPGR
jgi:hypothetical protein